jgi:hypothetical protein
VEAENRELLETHKADLESLLQSKGWALLRNSLLLAIAADKHAVSSAGTSLDSLIQNNLYAARIQVNRSLVDLPNNMLIDVQERLLEIYNEDNEQNS